MKYTDIPTDVRVRVYTRDSFDECPCCIICGRPYPQIHHYIERSRGGMGIEKNLVCLCASCHRKLHQSKYSEYTEFVRDYLKAHYEDWNEEELIYRKDNDEHI